MVSGEARHLFLHLWAVWISPTGTRHCPVLGEALLGVSSLPPPPPGPQTVALWGAMSQAAKLCFLLGWLPGEEGVGSQTPAASQSRG